jgi:hypothetical protein
MEYCCKELKDCIEDKHDPIEYNSFLREYYIIQNKKETVIRISYCPFCGCLLPKSLRVNFFNTLEDEFGLDIEIKNIRSNPLIPSEFQSDQWWKKRGL